MKLTLNYDTNKGFQSYINPLILLGTLSNKSVQKTPTD